MRRIEKIKSLAAGFLEAVANWTEKRGLSFNPRRLLARYKLPGWLISLLGVVQRLSGWEDHIRFTFDAVKEMGGDPALFASIASSWITSAGLIVAGMAYVVFVGEPKEGTLRHPWLPVIGWSVFGTCAVALSLLIGGVYVEGLRLEAYSNGQRDAHQDRAPGRGVRAVLAGGLDRRQVARAGKLTRAVSLTAPSVSRLM